MAEHGNRSDARGQDGTGDAVREVEPIGIVGEHCRQWQQRQEHDCRHTPAESRRRVSRQLRPQPRQRVARQRRRIDIDRDLPEQGRELRDRRWIGLAVRALRDVLHQCVSFAVGFAHCRACFRTSSVRRATA